VQIVFVLENDLGEPRSFVGQRASTLSILNLQLAQNVPSCLIKQQTLMLQTQLTLCRSEGSDWGSSEGACVKAAAGGKRMNLRADERMPTSRFRV
jgi:hypothetical protein